MHSLTSSLDGGEWSASRPGRFTPREGAPCTHWIGGWVGPRIVLDAVVKRKIPSPRRESNPGTQIVQPVAQLCTDWAVMAQLHVGLTTFKFKILAVYLSDHDSRICNFKVEIPSVHQIVDKVKSRRQVFKFKKKSNVSRSDQILKFSYTWNGK
jgi:hypothetical protein